MSFAAFAALREMPFAFVSAFGSGLSGLYMILHRGPCSSVCPGKNNPHPFSLPLRGRGRVRVLLSFGTSGYSVVDRY
jgi:hypothetical protein